MSDTNSQISFASEEDQLRHAIFRTQWLNFVAKESALPPILSTDSFSDNLIDELANLTSFQPTNSLPHYNSSAKAVKPSFAAPSTYQIVRFDGKVRFLELPHPWPYAHLGKLIVENWSKLKNFCNSKESELAPRFDLKSSRVIAYNYRNQKENTDGQNQHHWLSLARLSSSSGTSTRASFPNPVLLKLDIASFFPSIYLHSIDWAIQGKRTNDSTTLGAKLDRAFQFTRNQRTDGLAIGPVTSNIAAEIILNEIDTELRKEKIEGKIDFRRYVDDIHILTDASYPIQDLVNKISVSLRKYSLSLNQAKQSVTTPYSEFSSDIEGKVETFLEQLTQVNSPRRVRQFMADLHRFSLEESHLSVLRYSWQTIVRTLSQKENPSVLMEFTLESLHFLHDHPDLVSRVARLLEDDSDLRFAISAHSSTVALLSDLLRNSLLSGSTEFSCWLIYIFKLLDLDLSHSIWEVVKQTEPKNSNLVPTFFDCPNSIDDTHQEVLLSLLSPLVALCILDESAAASQNSLRNRDLSEAQVQHLILSIYSGVLKSNDSRMDTWSPSWPIRYHLFLEGLLLPSDLFPTEEATFGVMENHGFSLLN